MLAVCWGYVGSKSVFCKFLAPQGPQHGAKLEACWGQVGSFWQHFCVFCGFQVQVQLRRLKTLIFCRFWGWCWVSRRQQNIVNNGSESTSGTLVQDRFEVQSWTIFWSILGGFWVSKLVMLGFGGAWKCSLKGVVRCDVF